MILFLETRIYGQEKDRVVDMYRLFPIIVSVLVLASCRSESVPVVSFDEIIKYETISHTESLKSEDVSHEIPFASIDFRIIDTLCIFSANDPDNGFFKICGLSGFSTTLDVVKRGNGPNELLWYQYFNEIAFRHESDSLIAYMRNNK